MSNLPAGSSQRKLAMFVDFENLALGFGTRKTEEFQIHLILDRLVEKGKVIVKVAYADWSRFRKHTQDLHEAGLELIEIPRRVMTGKNSADIRMVVDAMDLSYSKEHIDTFVIVSGDSDFTPLVSKLKENGKHVIGMGMKDSTSNLLADNCDEFIYYEDLGREEHPQPASATGKEVGKDKREVYLLLFDAIRALQRENYEVLYSSMVKDTMKRKRPSFNEASSGYRSFSDLLEDAEEQGYVKLREDPRSGTYVVAELLVDQGRRRKR
jgi:uncharacterized protein (TIGR00288 family)